MLFTWSELGGDSDVREGLIGYRIFRRKKAFRGEIQVEGRSLTVSSVVVTDKGLRLISWHGVVESVCVHRREYGYLMVRILRPILFKGLLT
jgi:hypothetical protein